MPTPVYGIFEGGGAKGLGHIAALKAVERNDLELIGVAGASAGALIASLVAVGYEANEIFDPDTPLSNLLSRNGISPLSLLGEAEWAKFQLATRKAAGTATAAAIGGRAAAWIWSRKTVGVASQVKATGGYFSTERVREELNRFLRTRLVQHHANAGRDVVPPDRVRFRDIDPRIAPECISLKVIVSDITNRRMVVFDSSPDYADVEVAEAVVASISIPLVFKPARIPSYIAGGDALYADGGLVSNLPVWVFTEEKQNFERAYLPNGKVRVLAFSLADETQPQNAPLQPNDFAYWGAVGRTAIFGGQSVAQRFASDLLPVEMPIRLGVTEFDFTIRRALDGYLESYAAAARILVRETRLRPVAIARDLRDFHDRTAALLAAKPYGAAIGTLRISLIQPYGAASFRVTASCNMDRDADDRLIFSGLTQGAPIAFNRREPAYIDFATLRGQGAPPNMTKYEFALVRPQMASAICLPIFSNADCWQVAPGQRPHPLGVVSIDSDQPLTQLFHDQAAMQDLATSSLALNAALQP